MFENNKRTYDCFCCEMKFPRTLDGWESFKEHMQSEHREGDDYVICKIKNCEAPVRDMLLHFKVFHPGQPIPSGTMLRALIWRDQKTRRKKKKTQFKSGEFVSIKNNGATFKFRSSWELEIFNILEEWSRVLRYEVESMKIPYYFKGKWRKYIPDLKIKFDDGHIEVWECKPRSQTGFEINQAKWTACKKLCEELGIKFQIITQNEIKTLQQMLLLERKK